MRTRMPYAYACVMSRTIIAVSQSSCVEQQFESSRRCWRNQYDIETSNGKMIHHQKWCGRHHHHASHDTQEPARNEAAGTCSCLELVYIHTQSCFG